MRGSLKSEAVVLRSMRYGEADRILHLYTPDRGRLSAIAKGVRRSKSRFGGRLEPYFRLRLVLYQGRSDLLTVTSAETLHGHPRLREHAAALDGASRACDAVARRVRRRRPAQRRLPPAGQPARAARRRSRARDARERARLPAQAAARRRLRAAARRLRRLRGEASTWPASRAPRAASSARPARRARSRSARRRTTSSSARSAARWPMRRTRRRARWRRRSGRSWRRSSTTRTCAAPASARSDVHTRAWHVQTWHPLHRNCAFAPARPRGASEWEA